MYNGNTFEDKVPVEDLLSSMETSTKETSRGVQLRIIEEDRVYSRAQIRYTNLEKDVENLKMLLCDTWEDGDDELDIALEGLTQELIPYEKKFLNIPRENDEIIERCNCIVIASKPKVGNRTRNTGGAYPLHCPTVVSNHSQISSPHS